MARFIVDIANMSRDEQKKWINETLDDSLIMSIYNIDSTCKGAFYNVDDKHKNRLHFHQVHQANYLLSDKATYANDKLCNELIVGDITVIADIDDSLDFIEGEELLKGDRLEVVSIDDIESNYITFKSDKGLIYNIFGHRVIKL